MQNGKEKLCFFLVYKASEKLFAPEYLLPPKQISAQTTITRTRTANKTPINQGEKRNNFFGKCIIKELKVLFVKIQIFHKKRKDSKNAIL